jgi:hypothetical protein
MRTVTNIGLILAYVVAAPILGLFASTGIYLTLHMLFLGVRPVGLVLAIAAGAVAIMYAFFGLLLGVNMPDAIFI